VTEASRKAANLRKFELKAAAQMREMAQRAKVEAEEFEQRYENAPEWSAAATCAPNARRRAAQYDHQAHHLEQGTWVDHLKATGRWIDVRLPRADDAAPQASERSTT
jgi:hypothetical protein